MSDERPCEKDTTGAVRNYRVSVQRDEATAWRLNRGFRFFHRFYRPRVDTYYKYYYFTSLYYRDYIKKISKRIEDWKPDVIVVPNFTQFLPFLRTRNPNVKIVLNMQCDWLIELPPNIVRPRLKLVDMVTGCSDYIVDGITRAYPDIAPQCRTLYNGCNLDLFSNRDKNHDVLSRLRTELALKDKTVVTFVGRVAPEKGVHVLLEAMRSVVVTAPDTVLLIVGNISKQPPSPKWLFGHDREFQAYEELKIDYGAHLSERAADIKENVRFVGFIPHYELIDYYNITDIFVHPAVWNEPFGMILTEAMACALPVVSTRSGGIPEIVEDGMTGLLADRRDPETLANAILQLSMDRHRRVEMGRNGLERVKTMFSWEHTANAFSEMLEAL